MTWRVLDAYCGAGGMSAGLAAAGLAVAGIDHRPMPRYPFPFSRGDVPGLLAWLAFSQPAASRVTVPGLGAFDAICASPPCHDHISRGRPEPDGTGWMLGHTRAMLERLAVPWVIENVPGAPMRADLKLCACLFPGLRNGDGMLVRERWFETSWRAFELRAPCYHPLPAITVIGHGTPSWSRRDLPGGKGASVADRRKIMGIPWMNRDELSQAIPPAYGEHVGGHLAAELDRRAEWAPQP